jgi:hypothetical protein
MSDSDTLQALNEDFATIPFRGEILSFYETLGTSTVGAVVEKQSTFLGLPNERLISINANHAGLVKFATANSEGYRIISNAIRRLNSNLPDTVTPHSNETVPSRDGGLGRTTVEEFYSLTDVEISSHPRNVKRSKRDIIQGVFDGRTQVDQTARQAFDSLSEFLDFETGR